jgi:hypothetical protein
VVPGITLDALVAFGLRTGCMCESNTATQRDFILFSFHDASIAPISLLTNIYFLYLPQDASAAAQPIYSSRTVKISNPHFTRALYDHSCAGLETRLGPYIYYLPRFIASPSLSLVSVHSYYHLISPFCSNPYVTVDLEARTCSDCAGEHSAWIGHPSRR